MAQNIKIQVILGSIRQGRNGDKVYSWLKQFVAKRKDATFEFIDLKDWPLPLFAESVSPAYSGGKYTNKMQAKWSETIKQGDGFIIVTPEYNHGYTAVLKNALDYLYSEWNNKPVGFVSYGGSSGGIRAVEQLREVAVELKMVPVRDEMNFAAVWEAFDEKGNPKNKDTAEQKTNAMIEQLLIYAKACQTMRKA